MRLFLLALVVLGLVPAYAEQHIASRGTPGAFEIQVNPVTSKAYVATGSGVWVIEGAAHTLAMVAGGEPVVGIAVDPLANRIFAVRAGSPGAVDVIDGTTHAVTRVLVGPSPQQIVVNPVTGEAYVTIASGVTVINGTTLATTTLSVGPDPSGLAVNPVTNKIYVACAGGIGVIDGATKTNGTLMTSSLRNVSIAVNPVTNKVYVLSASSSLKAIDAATGTVVDVPVGTQPTAIAVNPVTNKIYVANMGPSVGFGGDVTVVDGVTNVPTTVGAGVLRNPVGFTVNPVTNLVYVRSGAGGATDVGVIDGATNGVRVFQASVPTSLVSTQTGIAINPVTNMLYVSQSMLGVDVIDASVNAQALIPMPAGVLRRVMAINPVTERLYVAHVGGNSVTVVDEATLAATDVLVGSNPVAIAVNFATDRIYVANQSSNSISVIAGATNAVATIPVSSPPGSLAINTVTNKIYVAGATDASNESVTVIDGATNATTTLPMGKPTGPIAVNEATNRVYVAHSSILTQANDSVTEIDGATLSSVGVLVGGKPSGIAVNPVTNRIYVSNNWSRDITVINGSTRGTTTVRAPHPPGPLAVNPITNKIYVGMTFGGGYVDVLDGVTNVLTPVIWMNAAVGFALDPVADRIYAVDSGHPSKVIDGPTRVTWETGVAAASGAVVNPVTGRVYFAHYDTAHITMLRPSIPRLVNHDTDVTMAGGHVTSQSMPTLSLAVCCPYAPNDPPVRAVYYRVGDARGVFSKAMGAPPFDARLSGLIPGLNFVTLFSADAMAGTSIQTRGATSAMIGAPRVFPLVYAPTSLVTMTAPAPVMIGGSVNQTLQVSGGIGPFTFALTDGSLPAGVTLSPAGVLSGTPTQAGFFPFTVTVTDANGGTSTSVLALTVLGSNPPRLGNISTRAQALSGNDVMIGGFVIGGSTSKTIVVRARGPSLVPFGIANALANPTLQLVRSADQSTVASNDDWGTATNAAVVTASGYAPSNALESALLVNLPPGAYTAIVSGANGGTGVAIVEVFELDRSESPLANISTRGQVLTGNDVMIGGFVVQGTGPRTVVVRARGPSLAPFGIANPLGNPELRLVRSSDQTNVASNDNWVNAPNRLALEASGFAPSNILESAILVTLDPGAYTAIVSGAGGTTGVGLVEVFTLP